jgi:TonB family protein
MKSITTGLALFVLAACCTVPAFGAQADSDAKSLERAYKLMSDGRWAEAAEAVRGYLREAGPDGTDLKEARILLCQARAHLPDEPLPTELDKDLSPLRVGGAVTRPEIISHVKPVYTEKARRAGTEGTVIVEAIIDEEGCVRNVRVLKEQPNGLTEAAVEAVRQWAFSPARLEDRPVKVYYVLTVNFGIQKPPPQQEHPTSPPG